MSEVSQGYRDAGITSYGAIHRLEEAKNKSRRFDYEKVLEAIYGGAKGGGKSVMFAKHGVKQAAYLQGKMDGERELMKEKLKDPGWDINLNDICGMHDWRNNQYAMIEAVLGIPIEDFCGRHGMSEAERDRFLNGRWRDS